MISLFHRLIGPLVTLVSTATVSAADFYVATNGNNSTGNGSLAQPWATIDHAVNTVPDGSTIIVRPGTYSGRVHLDRVFSQGITVRGETAYQARLRHNATVVTSYYGQGITLEGFDIAHNGPGAGALVIQIQDLIAGTNATGRITLRNNIIHDSYDNDLLKINNGAKQVTVAGNIFYNQAGSDEHIDINSVTDVVVEDNIFFNDFAGSGRVNANDTSSFVVIKDSNGNSDGQLGSERVTVRRNVFLNWEGSTGQSFVRCGEDSTANYEAIGVLVENNLMLGNATNVMRTAFTVQGSRDIAFRHNTVVGDLPSLAFAMRLIRLLPNQQNTNVIFYNNIWCDPAGTMGAENPTRPNDFSDTPPGETVAFQLKRNLFWNGPVSIPFDAAESVNYTNDVNRVVANPFLPPQAGLVLPRWSEGQGKFADGSTTIRQAFERLVALYGTPASGSPALNAADPTQSSGEDILGRPRSLGGVADIGAVERPTNTPAIKSIRPVPGTNRVQLEIEAGAGLACHLLAATTLANWQSVATNIAGSNGLVLFEQPMLPGGGFFRARLP